MDQKEHHNYFKLVTIVLNDVSELLRNVFKSEWDSTYPVPWGDDLPSLHRFSALEKPFYKMNKTQKKNYTNLMKTTGDRNTWDVTLLCYTLLYSTPLDLLSKPGKAGLANAIDNLRKLRNEVIHQDSTVCSDVEFKKIYKAIKVEIINIGPVGISYVKHIRSIKNSPLPKAEIDKLRTERDAERKIFKRQRTKHRLVNALLCFCIIVLAFIIYKVVEYYVPPEIPSHFPEFRIPTPLINRQNEIEQVVDTILSGTRVVILTGIFGIGRATTALAAGERLRHDRYFSVCFVSLDGVDDIDGLQRKILESFYVETESDVTKRFKDFLTHNIKRRTVVILDRANKLLESLIKHDAKDLLVEVLDWNENIHMIITTHVPIYLVKNDVTEIELGSVSKVTSLKFVKQFFDELNEEAAEEIGETCGGVPFLLTLFAAYKSYIHYDSDILITKIRQTSIDHTPQWDDIKTIKAIRIIFDVLHPELQQAVLAISVIPGSFSFATAETIVPSVKETLDTLMELKIITMTYMKGSLLQFEMHPIIRLFAHETCRSTTSEIQNLCQATKVAFQQHYMSLITHTAVKFTSNLTGDYCYPQTLFKETANLKLMLERGLKFTQLMDDYYDMLTKSFVFYFFDIHNSVFSRYIYFKAALAYRPVDYGRFMTLLYLLGDHGDVYLYNHKDKYDKTLLLIEESVDVIKDDNSCRSSVKTKEIGMCLLVKSKTFTIYPRMNESSEDVKGLFNASKGLTLLEMAENLFLSLKLRHEVADTLSLKGLVYINSGNYSEAISAYVQALNVFRELYGVHPFTAAALYNLAYVHYKSGGFSLLRAIDMFNQSYQIYNKTLGIHRRTSSAIFFVGSALQACGKFNESTEYLQAAYRIQDKVTKLHKDISKAPMDIAESLYMKYLHDNAHTTAVSKLQELQLPAGISIKAAFIAYFIGNCHASTGRRANAYTNYETAIDILDELCQGHEELCNVKNIVKKEKQVLADREENSGNRKLTETYLFSYMWDTVHILCKRLYNYVSVIFKLF